MSHNDDCSGVYLSAGNQWSRTVCACLCISPTTNKLGLSWLSLAMGCGKRLQWKRSWISSESSLRLKRCRESPEKKWKKHGSLFEWTKWSTIITGWWLGHPSEKYEFVNWDDDINPIYGKMPNSWQPVTTNQINSSADLRRLQLGSGKSRLFVERGIQHDPTAVATGLMITW